MLNDSEREHIFRLAGEITGTCQIGKYRHEVIVSNVERRMHIRKCKRLDRYLELTEQVPEEYRELVSALTIHTTSWFREMPHFERLTAALRDQIFELPNKRLRVLCAACSTGQEVYSIALLLEGIRAITPDFDYEIVGLDIDPCSIQKARSAIYPVSEFSTIPAPYRRGLMLGSGRTAGFFTLNKSIRSRCTFEVRSLQDLPFDKSGLFEIVFCRNVLIYFSPTDVPKVVKGLVSKLVPSGLLFLGHSESVGASEIGLEALGSAVYSSKRASSLPLGSKSSGHLVLVVDDCPITRRLLSRQLEKRGYFCDAVASANEATEYLKKRSVDLITLDLNMPGIDGSSWLRAQRGGGLRVPVVVVSSGSDNDAVEVLGALEDGAQDYIDKAKIDGDEWIARVGGLISSSRRRQSLGSAPRNVRRVELPSGAPDLIVIGASTGGTEALTSLLRDMPRNSPPVLVAQHIQAHCAMPFAERLAKVSNLILKKPVNGMRLEPGHLYLSPGELHIGVKFTASGPLLDLSDTAPINRHRPSVDYLFRTASLSKKRRVWGILLTGMGDDGARGLSELKQAGGVTICQDESSCVVFGMPKEAIKLGAAIMVGNLKEIRDAINTALRGGRGQTVEGAPQL